MKRKRGADGDAASARKETSALQQKLARVERVGLVAFTVTYCLHIRYACGRTVGPGVVKCNDTVAYTTSIPDMNTLRDSNRYETHLFYPRELLLQGKSLLPCRGRVTVGVARPFRDFLLGACRLAFSFCVAKRGRRQGGHKRVLLASEATHIHIKCRGGAEGMQHGRKYPHTLYYIADPTQKGAVWQAIAPAGGGHVDSRQ